MSLHVNWVGHACFKLVAPDLTVITDPLDTDTGYNPPRTSADVVTVSSHNPHHSNVSAVKDEPIVFDGPGEYEVSGALLQGIGSRGPADHPHNTVFTMRLDDIRVCHLGALGDALTDEQIERIGAVDVLLLPAGMPDALNEKHATSLMNAIDPRIVIPYGFETKKSALSGVESPDTFLKAMGMKATDTVPKLVLKKKDLPTEETDVYLLEPQG